MNNGVVVVAGAGGIGLEIARRLGPGKRVLLADNNEAVLASATETLAGEGYEVNATAVDISSRASVQAFASAAAELGSLTDVVLTAGVAGDQRPPSVILQVNLLGTAIFLEEFAGRVAPQGAGLVITSISGHLAARLPQDVEYALATAPVDELLTLPASVAAQSDGTTAYRYTKRANQLRVQAASVTWGRRPARINSVSPGVIMSPLTKPALAGPVGAGVRAMIAASAAGRIGIASDIAHAATFLMSPASSFITGSDLLVDGGTVAALRYGPDAGSPAAG